MIGGKGRRVNGSAEVEVEVEVEAEGGESSMSASAIGILGVSGRMNFFL